ncbi:MAG: META domain-containing protein [Deltaproteobacteria bacterium]|nr:META domain-containing protein [Deltaproteobacteria bacterium]
MTRSLALVIAASLSLPGAAGADEPASPTQPGERRGRFVYMADAATFFDCRVRQRYPVAMESMNAEIERAYLAARAAPGAPVLASLDGHVVSRRPEPGAPEREHLVITRFVRFWPGETCAREALAPADLLGTWWRPVAIGDAAARVAPNEREPHFVLSGGEGESRLRGSTGCNAISGAFERNGPAPDGLHPLRFGPLASTMKACAPEISAQETAFLRALDATASYRIVGDALDLLDSSQTVIMRLEARRME